MSQPPPVPMVQPTASLQVTTTEITDPGDLLALIPTHDRALAWVRRGEGMVAWGESARFSATGDRQMLDGDAWFREIAADATIRDEVGLPGTGLVAFGSFAFAADDPGGGALIVPRVIVGRRRTANGIRAWLTTIGASGAGSSDVPREEVTPPRAVTWSAGSSTPEEWRGKVAQAVAAIRSGQASKVVLARDMWARSTEVLDPRALVQHFVARYPTTWAFAVDGLVGGTPELLVRSERGLVASRVLAGTIRRTGNDDADLAHAAALARSSKDLTEHEYAVASLAQALEPFVNSANVPEVPSVLHLPNVMHLATDVTAALHADTDGSHPSALVLADSLHPTAAVGGTPRRAAVELVQRIEGMNRGRYAGPVGWLGADGDGEFCIALRCGAIPASDPRAIRVFAGCGIVAASDPGAELDETEAKFEPMRQALSDA